MNSSLNEFDESRPEFKGFNDLYNDHIYPYLENIEQERVSAVDNAKRVGGGIALSGLGIAFFIFKNFMQFHSQFLRQSVAVFLATQSCTR